MWDYSNTGHADGRHCSDFGLNFPYVFIATGARDSKRLHYGGNVTILGASGCIEFKLADPNP